MTTATEPQVSTIETETEEVPGTKMDEQFWSKHVDSALISLRQQNAAQSKTIANLLKMVETLQTRLDKAQQWAIKVNERVNHAEHATNQHKYQG